MSLDRSDAPITYGDLKRLFFRVKGVLKKVFWIAGGGIALILFCTPPTFLARATFKEGRITSPSDTEWKEWFQKIGGTSGKTVAKGLMQSESLLRDVVCELGMQVERAPRFPVGKFFKGLWDNGRLMFGQRPVEQETFEVIFRDKVIGRYNADLVVGETVIVELKCCESLIREHQAQLFNYLRVSQLPIGLLVNFRRRKLEYQRLHRSEEFKCENESIEEPIPF